MFVRKLTPRGRAKDEGETRPRRNRAWMFAWLTFGVGAAAGIAALVSPMVTDLQTLVINLTNSSGSSQIEASAVFPSVSPVQKVVDVYDPAPARPKSVPQPPVAQPIATPHQHHPSPSPHASPSPDD